MFRIFYRALPAGYVTSKLTFYVFANNLRTFQKSIKLSNLKLICKFNVPINPIISISRKLINSILNLKSIVDIREKIPLCHHTNRFLIIFLVRPCKLFTYVIFTKKLKQFPESNQQLIAFPSNFKLCFTQSNFQKSLLKVSNLFWGKMREGRLSIFFKVYNFKILPRLLLSVINVVHPFSNLINATQIWARNGITAGQLDLGAGSQ